MRPRVLAASLVLLTTAAAGATPALQLRGGLPHSSGQFAAGRGHVVFMGGSITRMGATADPSWTQMVERDLRRRFPGCRFRFGNAGISSIGTPGHAHRFERDVLAEGTPDLLFIEAAVNDLHNGRSAAEARRGMEGVVRSARQHGIELLMVHFADGPHLADYAGGDTPMVIAEHEAVAEHYAVPSLDLARHVQNEIAAGTMDWKRDFKGNCHVPAFGQKLYAEQIGLLFDRAWANDADCKGQRLPANPLDPACYLDGSLHSPGEARDLEGAEVIATWKPADRAGTRAGFVDVAVLEARGSGSSFSFSFQGTGAGLWTIAGPDAARIRWRVDNGGWKELDTFTRWSGRLHLPFARILASGLKQGPHRIVIEVLPRPAGQAGGEALRVSHLLSHGNSSRPGNTNNFYIPNASDPPPRP